MRYVLITLLFVCILGCKAEPKTSEPLAKEFKHSLHSVELATGISKKIENNEEVSEQEWEALFASNGYQAYFCAFDRQQTEPKLKEAFYMVFNPKQKVKLDSILEASVPFGLEGQFNMIVQNLNDFKKNRAAVEAFMAETDFEAIFKNGHELTLNYLPEDVDTENVELHEVNFILMEPGAYVTDCGLIVDFNNAFRMGAEELTKMIGHEFHHNYRNTELSLPGAMLMSNLNDIQAEGIADIIDKEVPPYSSLDNLPLNIVETINEMNANTPQILNKLDSLTVAMLDGTLDASDYNGMTMRYFQDGGHANGHYMSLKIKEAGLEQQMITTYRDPVAFVELYNESIEGQEGEYRFSDTFITYAKDLQEAHLEELSNVSDETFEVTFVVEVPNEDSEVYITGNQSPLGDWDPGKVKLETGSSSSRTITLQLQSPAQFKFTGGSWKKEAVMEGKTGTANLKLSFANDTIVRHTIVGWGDE